MSDITNTARALAMVCDRRYLRETAATLRACAIEIERLMEEITDGDYWRKRATQAIENGTCPICFSGDEGGHKDGCLWGEAEDRADQLEDERSSG